jgi:hypothetical protein
MIKQCKSVELFLTLGLAATVTTTMTACSGSVPPPAPSGQEASKSAAPIASSSATIHAGGEGGEGGESASSGNPDVDYMVTLGLMKGHLIVAQELLEQKNYPEAEPHIGHPVDELYGEIEGQLSSRKVPAFKSTLNQLHDLVKSAPTSPQVPVLYQSAVQAIDQAIAALPDSQRQSPEFILPVLHRILQTAGEEYTASIADGRFTEQIEYQDSRGFVLYASELYQNIAQSMSQTRPDVHQTITETFRRLQTAWPTVVPPQQPIQTPAQVQQLISQINVKGSPKSE